MSTAAVRPARTLRDALACAAFLCGWFAGGVLAAGPEGLAETDFVLLEVRLDGRQLSDALPAYQRGKDLLLPIGELSRILTLAIKTDLDKSTATGFVISQERNFHFDAATGRVELNGRIKEVPSSQFGLGDDDIYVAVALLQQWLPVDLAANLSALALLATAREPLPLQLRLEREERAAASGRAGREMPAYELRRSPYRWIDVPFVDTTLAAEARDSAGQQTVDSQYSLFATGDLLLMEGAFYAGRTADETDVRATLGRHDPGAGLLGPLHARSFAVGSLTVPGVENVARTSPVGFGASVSNRALTRPLTFDRHSLQGDLPPGWDVELYFNGALIGLQQSRPDNRYEFNDIPLLYGVNEFRLVFHGPQGQLRVERSEFLLEDALIRAGEFEYQFAGNRDEDSGEPRFLGRFDYGLTRHLSVTAGAYGFTQDDAAQRRYGFGGLRLAFGPMLVNAEGTRLQDGGTLGQLGLKARFAGLTFGLKRNELADFTSEYFSDTIDPVLTRDEGRVDGILRLGPTFPVALEARRDRLESGLENREAAGRLSTYLARTSLTAQYHWLDQSGLTTADGALQVSRRVAGTGLRGQVNYLFEPATQMATATLAADRNLGAGYHLSASILRSFIEPATQYNVGLDKVLGEFALGAAAGYSTLDEVTLGLRLFMGFGRDRTTGIWHRSAQPMADTGAISAEVFVDRNLNGHRDPGEAPVPGAEFIVAGARQQIRSDANGHAYLGRLLPRDYADVAVDQNTLEDPQWSSRPEGVRILPRPGHVQTMDLPVILTSEIDGTLYVADGGKRRGVPGVRLELQDPAGRVVSSATTAWDGFYILERVPPGEYLLVSPQHIQRGLKLDPGVRVVQVPADGNLVSGVDFLVERRPALSGANVPRITAKAVAAARTHLVMRGEWLWMIAERYYGHATTAAVQEIIRANPGVISPGGHIQPGSTIAIPAR